MQHVLQIVRPRPIVDCVRRHAEHLTPSLIQLLMFIHFNSFAAE